MKLSRNIAVAIIVTTFLGSVLGQGLWANTVFCISGPDHAAFEPGQNGRCLPSPGESKGSHRTDGLSSGTVCDPCFDMPFWDYTSWQRKAETNPIPDNGLLFSPQGTIPDGFTPSLHPAPRTAPPPSSTLLSLRTQILII